MDGHQVVYYVVLIDKPDGLACMECSVDGGACEFGRSFNQTAVWLLYAGIDQCIPLTPPDAPFPSPLLGLPGLVLPAPLSPALLRPLWWRLDLICACIGAPSCVHAHVGAAQLLWSLGFREACLVTVQD